MHVILGPQPSARFLAVSLSFVNSLHKSLGKRPRIALHATLTRPEKLKRSNTLRNLQGHRSERCWGPERMEISLVTSWSNAPAPGRRVSCKQRMEQRKERLETVGMWHHNCLGVQDWSEQTLCNQGYQKKNVGIWAPYSYGEISPLRDLNCDTNPLVFGAFLGVDLVDQNDPPTFLVKLFLW